jgi:hypothetical protein
MIIMRSKSILELALSAGASVISVFREGFWCSFSVLYSTGLRLNYLPHPFVLSNWTF